MTVDDPVPGGTDVQLTARGRATRDRIVESAANLMYHRGVNATTLDDVRIASGTSKSQLYRHFPDKDALVRAVVASQSDKIMAREHRQLERFTSMAGLHRWRDALVRLNSLQDGAYGCALGSLAVELADQDELARTGLDETFRTWEQLIAAGLHRMQDAGRLRASADPEALAIGLMAALQGGYLLARTAHDTAPMRIALDMALAHIGSELTDAS